LFQLVRRSEEQTVQQMKTVWAVKLGNLVTIKVQRKTDADS
jgi:hypothetical protein